MTKVEKNQSKKGHPTEEQANMEESKKKGENETTGFKQDSPEKKEK